MAPQREFAVATVYSTQVRSHDERAVLVEAGGFTPMRWYLEHGDRPYDYQNDEPPEKKQKIVETFEMPAAAPDHNIIPLFGVTIDFHFPDRMNVVSQSAESLLEDVDFTGATSLPVVPYGISSDHTGTKLRLGLAHHRRPVLLVDCAVVPDALLDLLRSIALPGKFRYSTAKARRKDHPASVLSCTLTRSIGPTYTVVRLKAKLGWRSGESAFPSGSPVGAARVYPDYNLLLRAYLDHERDAFDHSRHFSPREFYQSVHAPSKDIDTKGLFENVLTTDLYPFQKRAVSWMLERESIGPSREVSPMTDHGSGDRSTCQHRYGKYLEPDTRFYSAVVDSDGVTCWVNHLQGIISRSPPGVGPARLSGGLLAEEMGLGKTVELMALISLHRRPQFSPAKFSDRSSDTMVSPSKATLIVTPKTLTQQWKSELSRHAPDLKVQYYDGITTGHKKSLSEELIIDQLCQEYDVVVTTYSVLGRELHFAEGPPDRNMRHAPKFERKRSPLVQIHWWRVCLDEAQMVESGVTAAARVACRLPRVHSWAVSGTPLRKDAQDLLGLLVFLGYQPFSGNANLWSHLIANHRQHLPKIFKEIALRHTKAQIRGELQLPPQKRVVVTVPFSIVEQQNYTELFNQMCEEIGVNGTGSPNVDDWNPEDPAILEGMRTWLVRLRQTCLHPQVGAKNRRALGNGNKPLRTVAEVLEVMIEQNETSLRVEERASITASLRRAHVLGNNGQDVHRSEKALEIYASAIVTSERMVSDTRARLSQAESDAEGSAAATGSEKPTDSEGEISESTSLLGPLRNNLRVALQLLHQCTFFAATSYFQIKSNEALVVEGSDRFKDLESRETALYETAKATRKEILRDTHRKADGFMRKIRDLGQTDRYTRLPKIKDLDLGGIESRRVVEKSDALFDVIREQVKVMREWRGKMADFLLKPLVDEDDGVEELKGDEYEESTKQQDELYVYFDAFKALEADLNTFITGESAPLIDSEVKFNIKNAKWVLNPNIVDDQKPLGVHAPQLALDLYAIRNKFRGRVDEVGSVRSLIQEARSLEGSMQFGGTGSRAGVEHALIQKHIASLQSVFSEYTKALAGLAKEVDLFRTTQNQRVEFYRQLQELSDSVVPYKEELDENLDQIAFEAAVRQEQQASKVLSRLQTRNRFLLHLRADSEGQAGSKTCAICISVFEQGVLTGCGHEFCKDCLMHWLAQVRSCPICKQPLSSRDIHEITLKPKEIRAQEESSNEATSQASEAIGSAGSVGSLYTDVESSLMNEIKNIDLPISYGTKIDTIGRHLKWIREHDATSKSIIFSQFREFLDVLGTALKEFKIGYARLGRAGAVEKFRNDASVDCLLLDAKTDSSGLTLVNAQNVFLCEPLIQTAVELQAIARVHRIGQTRATKVWMYLISDTVEEAIYETSVSRRLTHVQQSQQQMSLLEVPGKGRSATPAPLQENAIDAANSEELQSAPLTKLLVAGKGGGERVGNEDLWTCLFAKTQKPMNEATQRAVDSHLRGEAAAQRMLDAEAGAQNDGLA